MKKFILFSVFQITALSALAQPGAPDPFPLEQRVANLESRVAALEKSAMTVGVKSNQYSSYDELRAAVKGGVYATLAVGVNEVAELHVPSGFMGMSDGVYSIFPGEPLMVKKFGTTALGQQTQFPIARTGPVIIGSSPVTVPLRPFVFSNTADVCDTTYSYAPSVVTTTAFGNTLAVPANVSTRNTTCVNGVCTTESASVSTRAKLFPNAPWNK